MAKKGYRQIKGEEDALQVLCVDLFNRFVPPETALLIAIPNGGDRHPAVGAKLKMMGAVSGVPDLAILMKDQRVHWVELKRPDKFELNPKTMNMVKRAGGKLSDNQKAFMEKLDALSHCYDVVDNIDDFWEVVLRLGITDRRINMGTNKS